MRNRNITRQGFTLIELMVTILLASILFMGVAIVMADSIKGYDKMFGRVHGQVVNDAYVARITFDSICRKSSRYGTDVIYDSAVPDQITLFLYSNNITPPFAPDRYAAFYLNSVGEMILEQGPASYDKDTGWSTSPPDPPIVVASNVTELIFSVNARSVQMTATIDDGGHGLTVTSTAIRHN